MKLIEVVENHIKENNIDVLGYKRVKPSELNKGDLVFYFRLMKETGLIKSGKYFFISMKKKEDVVKIYFSTQFGNGFFGINYDTKEFILMKQETSEINIMKEKIKKLEESQERLIEQINILKNKMN